HGRRLSREHLLEVAAHGFEAIEVFATRTHFDYHSTAAVGDLQQWLAEAGMVLHGIHAPIAEGLTAGQWGSMLSLASADADARARQPRQNRRSSGALRRHDRLAVGADGDSEGGIRRHAAVRDRRPRSAEGDLEEGVKGTAADGTVSGHIEPHISHGTRVHRRD